MATKPTSPAEELRRGHSLGADDLTVYLCQANHELLVWGRHLWLERRGRWVIAIYDVIGEITLKQELVESTYRCCCGGDVKKRQRHVGGQRAAALASIRQIAGAAAVVEELGLRRLRRFSQLDVRRFERTITSSYPISEGHLYGWGDGE